MELRRPNGQNIELELERRLTRTVFVVKIPGQRNVSIGVEHKDPEQGDQGKHHTEREANAILEPTLP